MKKSFPRMLIFAIIAYVAAFSLNGCAGGSCGGCSLFGYVNRDEYYPPYYQFQLSYQFQELRSLNDDFDWDEIPETIPRDGSLSKTHFKVDGELYVLYHSCIQPQNYYNVFYVYKGDTLIGEIIGGHRMANLGFLLHGNYLYYCADATGLSSFMSLNVSTGLFSALTKAQYEAAYYQIEPPPSLLPENGAYKDYAHMLNKNFIAGSDNHFRYNDQTYFVDNNAGGGIPHGGALCKYAGEGNAYEKIARMGKLPTGCVLHGDYVYYWYGSELWHNGLTGIDVSMQKQANFARLSLLTLENEPTSERAYLEAWNSYEYVYGW